MSFTEIAVTPARMNRMPRVFLSICALIRIG